MGIFDRGNSADRARWEQLSSLVQTGFENFRKIGTALREIRDKELYKFEYATFEACCSARWKITAQHAGRLITATTIAELLEPTGYSPTTERQVRPLAALPPEQQAAAWTEAQESGGTPEAVATAVAKRRRKNSRKPKLARPIKLRCAGGTVTITPNRKFSSAVLTLTHALQQIEATQREAA